MVKGLFIRDINVEEGKLVVTVGKTAAEMEIETSSGRLEILNRDGFVGKRDDLQTMPNVYVFQVEEGKCRAVEGADPIVLDKYLDMVCHMPGMHPRVIKMIELHKQGLSQVGYPVLEPQSIGDFRPIRIF